MATVVIVAEMGLTIFGGTTSSLNLSSVDWWAMLASLLLLGMFLVVEGTDPRGWIASEPEHVLIGLHLLSVSLLWWLGVECRRLPPGS